MTQPDIDLSLDEMRGHARTVDETSVMIDEALAGATHVRAGVESYGLLVGPQITTVLNPFLDRAIGELRRAVSTTQSLADTLRAVADDFDQSDENAAHRLGAGG
jgi:hypothetical protein